MGKNFLQATNAYPLHITEEKDLVGLPDFVREGAAHEAKTRGLAGWVFTLQYPSYGPFMQYSENRPLREQLWLASSSRCTDVDFSNLVPVP